MEGVEEIRGIEA